MAEFDFGKVMGLDKEPDWLAKYEGTDLSPQEKFIAVAKDMQAPGAWDFLTTPELEPYKKHINLPDGTKIKNPMFGQAPTSYFENRAPILDRLEKTATELGVDPKTDPEFYVDGGQGRINLGVGNTLYRNKSDTAIGGYEMEKGGFQFQDAKQGAPVGGVTYQKVDTDAFRDTVAPMVGQAIAGAVSAGAFNPITAGLLSGAATAAGGGDVKDVAASGLLNFAGAQYLPQAQGATDLGKATLGDYYQVAEGFDSVLDKGGNVSIDTSQYDRATDANYTPSEVGKGTEKPWLYTGDGYFVDMNTGESKQETNWEGIDYNPGEYYSQGDEKYEEVLAEPSFIQLLADLKGSTGDQRAYDNATDTPITRNMLAANGYAKREQEYPMFDIQPFEKTERMGDFLYDMEK